MTALVLTTGATALGTSWLLTPAARWWGRRVGGVVCRPASGPPAIGRIVPRAGSLALISAVTVATLLGWRALPDPAPYAMVLAASSLIVLGGLIDDWVHELGIRVKILLQLAAIGLLLGGGLQTRITLLPLWANVLLTVVWLLGVTNACNLLDILDGLVLGVACIIAVTFAWLALAGQDVAAAVLCAAIAGGAAGVWRYNRYPASIFLGDAGAQWLGFLFAAMAIALPYAPAERPVALVTPLLVLAVPLFDTAFVMLMRLRQRRSVLAKSADHYVLRWVAAGETPPQAVRRMWLLAAACSTAALAVYHGSNGIGLLAILLVAGGLAWAGRQAAALPRPARMAAPAS